MYIEGTHCNTIKAIYDQLIANIIPNGKKLKLLSLRSGTRQRCPLSSLLFNIVIRSPNTAVRPEKEKKNRGI